MGTKFLVILASIGLLATSTVIAAPATDAEKAPAVQTLADNDSSGDNAMAPPSSDSSSTDSQSAGSDNSQSGDNSQNAGSSGSSDEGTTDTSGDDDY